MNKIITNLILIAISLSSIYGQSLHCRVVAVTDKPQIKHSSWVRGTVGCSDIRRDAQFAQKLFGDVVYYGIEIRAQGKKTIFWLKDDKANVVVIPPDSSQKDYPPGNTPQKDEEENPGRLAPSNK